MASAGDLSTPEPDIDVQDLTQTSLIRQKLKGANALSFFVAAEEAIISRRGQNVAKLLDLLILPEFFRRYTDGKCCFVWGSSEHGNRSGFIRGLAASEVSSWDWVLSNAPQVGFPMLRGYHRGPSTSFDLLFGTYLSFMIPDVQIVTIARHPGYIVFVLDKPHNLIESIPGDWQVAQDAYLHVASAHAGGGRRPLIRTPLTVPDAVSLVECTIRALNGAISQMTAPENYRTATSRFDVWSMLKQWILMERIAMEVGMAAATPSHFLRKVLAFAVADKLAAIGFRHARQVKEKKLRVASKQLTTKQHNSRLHRFLAGLEPELFSRLFVDPRVTRNFQMSLSAAESAVVQALAPTLGQLQRLFLDSVLRGLYMQESRAKPGSVILKARDRAKHLPLRARTLSEMNYALEFLRQMRNTHHGYGLYESKFERILAGHTAHFGDEAADIALLLWMGLVHEPKGLSGMWVDGLELRRSLI